MITFETQEDFEDAVMEVISERLRIIVEGGNGYVSVGLVDGDSDILMTEDSICDDIDVVV